MRPLPNLEETLKFLSIPHTFQIEKLLRKNYAPATAYLIDGLNDIPQVGFAVALERRFHYALDSKLGNQNPGFAFIDASFLESVDVFKSDTDGIKIYFGLDNTQNQLVPILTIIDVTDYRPETADKAAVFAMVNRLYYRSTSPTNGDWQLINGQEANSLRENYKAAVALINEPLDLGGQPKYRTEGYFIGRDALMNVMSDKPAHLFSTTIVRAGIKIYFGIQENLLYYDYEKGNPVEVGKNLSVISSGRDLHLILVGVDDPNLGPLASFTRVFATIETDVQSIIDGKLSDHDVHRIIATGIPCIVPDPRYPSDDTADNT